MAAGTIYTQDFSGVTNATDVAKVEGAPDLMILEVVIDSSEYTMGEAMSNYEYIKIFNK